MQWTMRGAVNGATPGALGTWSNWSAHAPGFDANWTFTLGESKHNGPANANILDFAMIEGDIFTMPALLADFAQYASTVYQG